MLAARKRMVAEEHHEFFSGETNPNDIFQNDKIPNPIYGKMR